MKKYFENLKESNKIIIDTLFNKVLIIIHGVV